MKQKKFHASRRLVHDVTMWSILIFSLCILNSSKVFGQCSCDDDLVTTVSLGDSEGFESYSANQSLPTGGRWSLFPSGNGYNPVPATVVSTPVNCGSRSLRFQYNGSNPVDMRYLIDPKRTSFKMYIPSGKGGTFSLLMADGQTPVLELQFGTGGTCTVNNGESFPFSQGSWFRVSIIRIDNTFKIFRDYDHVATFGTITEVEYANFDANNTNEQFYIDKLCTYFYNWAIVNCTQEYNPQCLNLSEDSAGPNSCEAMIPGYIEAEFFSCGSSSGSPCADAMPIYCGQTISGTTIGENFKFYRPDFGSCLGNNSSNDYRAPDKVYSFEHTGGDAQIHLWTNTPNVDLDIFLLSECGAAWSDNPQIVVVSVPPNTSNPYITCIDRGISYVDGSGYDTEYIFVRDLPPGTYYIVVDGQHWQNAGQIDDVGSFQLSLHCYDLDCSEPTALNCGEKLLNETNINGANNVSIYCGPQPNEAGSTSSLPAGTGCTGPERVYTFTPDIDGKVTVNVTGIGTNEDFDAFVFLSCDHTNCLATSTNGYGQSEELIFEGEKGQQYVIVIDGYKEITGNYDIEVVCPSAGYCDGCLQCFKHRPKFNATNTFELFSGWCDEETPTRMISYTNIWNVEGTSVQYIDNTNNLSKNPIIFFPTPGRYRICQKIYAGSILLHECCQWVNVKPCNGVPKAYFTSVYNSSDATYTIDATLSQNAENIEWQYSENGITYVSGNNTSSISKISIPNGTCTNVCIYVYNGCGVSTYCLTLCRGNSNCVGTVPPVLFTSLPNIEPDGRKITFTAPSIANATYLWDFGDGSPTVNSRTINYTYAKDGNHIVCLKVVIGCRIYCYCWCVRPRLCPPQFDPPSGMIKYAFTGSDVNPSYTITTQNFTVSPTEPWLLDDQAINNSINKNTISIALSQSRDYKICIPYLKPNGCVAYKCITIRGGNPFNCNSISWKYLPNQGYQFSLPSENSEIEWTVDETGQSLGTTSTSNIIPLPSTCLTRTISVKFFDGTRYIICCLRIYICNPVNCRDIIKFTNAGSQANFSIDEIGLSEFTWYFDDTPNSVLGASSSITIPYPDACQAKTISVRYRDASGQWRICCLVVYWCNPSLCSNNISINPNNNLYTLTTSSQYQELTWFADNLLLGQGNNLNIAIPSSTQKIYVRYRDPATGCVYICCKNFGGNPNGLILTLGSNICGSPNSEVLVPITVNNYNKIVGLQFSIASSNSLIAEITGFSNINPNSGIKASDLIINNGKLVFFTDSELIERTLANGSKLFDVKVKLTGSIGQSADINFVDNITALDINVNPIPLSVINGSTCIHNSLSISGRVTNANNKPLSTNALMTLSNNQSKALNQDGLYTFTDGLIAGNSYTLYPSYDENLSKGVDISDLLLLRRHMQGITLFNSPLQYYAADNNDDAKIDISDLLTMRKIMQGLTTQLTNGKLAWKFVPKTYTFQALPNPLKIDIPTQLVYIPLSQSQTNQDFFGVKRCDINHSLIPFRGEIVDQRSQSTTLKINDAEGVNNQEIYVDISVEGFNQVLANEFSIQWPTDKLELVSVPSDSDIKISGTTLFNESLLSQGKIGLFWESADLSLGTTLADNTVIYRFKFKILANNGSQVLVQAADEPRLGKLIDINGEVNVNIQSGTVTVGTSSSKDSDINQIKLMPNPTTGIVTIQSPYAINKITLIDLIGHKLPLSNIGNQIDVSNYQAGKYILSIHHQNGVSNLPLILIK